MKVGKFVHMWYVGGGACRSTLRGHEYYIQGFELELFCVLKTMNSL